PCSHALRGRGRDRRRPLRYRPSDVVPSFVVQSVRVLSAPIAHGAGSAGPRGTGIVRVLRSRRIVRHIRSAHPRGSGAREVGGVYLGAAGALTGVPVALRGGRGDGTAFGHGTVVMGEPDLTDRAFGDIGEDRREGRLVEGLAFEQLIGE